MRVELIDYMGSDLTVTNAARVSFNKQSAELSNKDIKLIHYLAKHNHFSPFTHPQITLRIKAPIFVARQLQRHTVGLTINEVSRRYVDDPPEFYLPATWRTRADNAKQGSGPDHPRSNDFTTSIDLYLDTVKKVYEVLCREIAPEQARMILPQSTYTEWFWTGSLMAFIRVCQLRLDSHTQKETQEIALQIKNLVEPLFPHSWAAWFS